MPLHERAEAFFVELPADSSSLFADGAPLDAGLAQILASNESHLARESCRQVVVDAPNRSFNRTAGKDFWQGVSDDAGPNASDIAALPADEAFKGLSWIAFTMRWEFFAICDRDDASGVAVARKLRGSLRYNNPVSVTAYAHVALTTHGSPIALRSGDLVYYSRSDISGSGAKHVLFTINPFVRDGLRDRVACRPGTTGAGPAFVGLMPLTLWVAIEADNFGTAGPELQTVSVWEQR